MNRLISKTAFLFDLDGTLVDSSALHERVFRQVLASYAPHCLEGFDYEVLKGKPTAQAFRELGIGEGAALDKLAGEKQRLYRAAVLAGELQLMPGAREILEWLACRGKRLFVVTGGSRRSVEAALGVPGIREFFEGIVTAEDVASGKPAPDSFLLCLSRFGVSAATAIGVEDSLNGAEACREAGIDVIVVHQTGFGDAWPIFHNLTEFLHVLAEEEELALA